MTMMPKPVSFTDETVTFSRDDWETLIERIEDAEDMASIHRSRANPETDPLRRGFTDAEVGRLLDDGATRLRVLRKRTGMNTRQPALEAGVNYAYVSEIETGKKPGSASALAKLAAALDVPMELLVGAGD